MWEIWGGEGVARIVDNFHPNRSPSLPSSQPGLTFHQGLSLASRASRLPQVPMRPERSACGWSRVRHAAHHHGSEPWPLSGAVRWSALHQGSPESSAGHGATASPERGRHPVRHPMSAHGASDAAAHDAPCEAALETVEASAPCNLVPERDRGETWLPRMPGYAPEST